jgi:hypothetical protein
MCEYFYTNPFIMKNLNKNEINISRFASKTMWTFVITTLISNVVNTMRFWNKLHQVRSQKWLENQIILSLLEQVNRIKHRANICQTGLKSFSRVSSNIVRIKAFLFFFKCIKIFTHLFLNGWFYNLPSIQFHGIINNLLFLRVFTTLDINVVITKVHMVLLAKRDILISFLFKFFIMKGLYILIKQLK